MKKGIVFILVTVFMSACYYKPFVKYRLNKNGFKKFSKKEFFAGDNANPFRNYDVKKYDWNLEVFPKSKKIAGDITIDFVADASQNTFMFDLQDGMKILEFKSSFGKPELKRKNDLLFFTFPQTVPKNTRISLYIKYKGKPKNVVGEGPIQWKKDKQDRDWISSSTEGIGPHFIMPCNGLLRDEADTTFINITVPKELVVASNGKMVDESLDFKSHKKTYKHLVTNPINIYNISFNIGHFVTFTKPYKDINGVERLIECQVMDYNQKEALKFYDQAPIIMAVFEEIYGEFPWWNDGCRFIESTFSAMEHQSGIAMGDDYSYDWEDYNMTLVHELAHEWWGNNVTAYDYCDAWIHEGLATYSEALFLEKIYGKEAYDKKVKYFYYGTANQIPIKKVCGVKYSSWISGPDMDIYDKGALLMHSLRMVVDNDELFMQAMFNFQKELPESNISADHFIQKFNNLLGNDYSALFDLYLNETNPPHLHFYKETTVEGQMFFNYKWSKALPFTLAKGISVEIDSEDIVLHPTTEFQKVEIKEGKGVKFLFPRSIYFLPREFK